MKKNIYVQPTIELVNVQNFRALCNVSNPLGNPLNLEEVGGGNNTGSGPIVG